MITYSQALKLVLSATPVLPTEKVEFCKLLGRTSRQRLVCNELVPPLDNSAMDGFAVQAAQLARATKEDPIRLRVLRTIAAGDAPKVENENSGPHCYSIMTGAPVPAGMDSVVRIEDVRVVLGGSHEWVEFIEPTAVGSNVRRAGEDFAPGQKVLEPGVALHSGHLMALASLGIGALEVTRSLKVAVLATGNELVELGEPLRSGAIRNSNSPYLMAELSSPGVEPRYFGVVDDRPESFFECMDRVYAWSPDIVISTGAVSMGKYDFVEPALGDLGLEILFHKVAIRPGKPILFASHGQNGPLFFGLPGNPISAAVGLEFFVRPAMRRMMGLPEISYGTAVLANDCKKPRHLLTFCKASVVSDGSAQLKVRVLPGQASFMVSPLLEANCWAILDDEREELEAGQRVQFALFSRSTVFTQEEG
ncbi:MAG: molybdopterin molybdotransferase MoeA [Bdellovibrionales bacterium]|nr:molybdopterin molybdotransferase MoeA [Bdellovibrionales bacterium]